MVWNDKACIGWFLFVCSSGNELAVPAQDVTSKMRMVGDVKVMKCIRVVPVKFKPGLGNTHEEAVYASSSVLGSSCDPPSPC